MPIDPITLAQAGPVAILLFGITMVVIGFTRGDIIPGFVYRQEQAQRAKAEAQAERSTEAMAALTATVQKALDVLLRDAGR